MSKGFEITNHDLVPLHEVLSKEEGEKVLKRFNIDKSQLPIISQNDVVAKSLEAKAGNIIKITRNSQTAGKAIYYRMVK